MQNCYQLQVVKLPATVVCFQQAAVVAPGCVDFGVRAFAEYFSLQHNGASFFCTVGDAMCAENAQVILHCL